MAIAIKQGDIFESGADILVNPVNCKGVMGAGLALEFKKRFPDMYKYYRWLCEGQMLKLGHVDFCPQLENNPIIVLFPTKYNWAEKSRLATIGNGMEDFVRQMRLFPDKSIALPALGCGLGGLSPKRVLPLMVEKLRPLKASHEVLIYVLKED
jgi:O-acetyl-ADP-ribose deacetylase (regulator of RNase III)